MRLYLDTMVWAYALENDPTFTIPARQFMERLRSGRHTILTSHFLFGELLVPHVRRQDSFLIASYRQKLFSVPATELVPFTMEVALHFASIRAHHRVKQPDAIHLALAASANADAFLTTDTRLNKLQVPGIRTIGDLTFSLS